MRIAVLCNGTVLMPAIEAIFSQNMLVGMAIPDQMSMINAPMEMAATRMGVPLTILYRKELSFQLTHWLEKLAPDVVCMMGFPYKIPDEVLKIPRYGFFNLHAGKLPEYAGPEPLFWQVKNEERKGMITIHRVESKMDGGDIAHQEPVIFSSDDTYGMAMQRLGFALPRALIAFIQQLTNRGEHLELTPQKKGDHPPSRRPTESDQMIDWSLSIHKIDAHIRACNPIYYGALTSLRGIPFRILSISQDFTHGDKTQSPGTIVSADEERGIHILCHQAQIASVNIICTEGGFITGNQFVRMMNLRTGEQFLPIRRSA